MFKENRFILIDILPPYRGGRKRGGFEVYRPKEFSKTVSGKLEKIERELSGDEAQKVLEKLNETGEIKCPKCGSKLVDEDDTDNKFYKFTCLDCGYKWKIKK